MARHARRMTTAERRLLRDVAAMEGFKTAAHYVDHHLRRKLVRDARRLGLMGGKNNASAPASLGSPVRSRSIPTTGTARQGRRASGRIERVGR